MSGVGDCKCGISVRVNSTLAVKAVAVLSKLRPAAARRLVREASAHAKRLRAACDRGDHGPGPKS